MKARFIAFCFQAMLVIFSTVSFPFSAFGDSASRVAVSALLSSLSGALPAGVTATYGSVDADASSGTVSVTRIVVRDARREPARVVSADSASASGVDLRVFLSDGRFRAKGLILRGVRDSASGFTANEFSASDVSSVSLREAMGLASERRGASSFVSFSSSTLDGIRHDSVSSLEASLRRSTSSEASIRPAVSVSTDRPSTDRPSRMSGEFRPEPAPRRR